MTSGSAAQGGERLGGTQPGQSIPRAAATEPTADGAKRRRTAASTAEPGGRMAGDVAHRRQPPRSVTRRYACPRCEAAAGEPCQGRRGSRKSHHIERVWSALEQLDASSQTSPRSARTSLPKAGSEAARQGAPAPYPEGVDDGGADGKVHEVRSAVRPR